CYVAATCPPRIAQKHECACEEITGNTAVIRLTPGRQSRANSRSLTPFAQWANGFGMTNKMQEEGPEKMRRGKRKKALGRKRAQGIRRCTRTETKKGGLKPPLQIMKSMTAVA